MSYIIEIICTCFGLFFVVMGAEKYSWWKGISIGGGFMPIIWGSLIVIFSVWMIVSKARRKQKNEKIDIKAMLPVIAMIVILAINYLLGLLIACLITSLLWLILVEKYSWVKSALIVVIMGIAVYGIFGYWLNVPFPKGLIGYIL